MKRWSINPGFKFYRQQDEKDCGPTCLQMVCHYFGRKMSIQKLRTLCFVDQSGVNLLALSDAAEKIGFRTTAAKVYADQLREVTLPCVLYWQQSHFVVLYKVRKDFFYLADPSRGYLKLRSAVFKKNWAGSGNKDIGILLLLQPGPDFYNREEEEIKAVSWGLIFRYFSAYKQLLLQLLIGTAFSSLFAIATPFLTQAMVDGGIGVRNVGVVYLILMAQVMLFLGATGINFIRSWILLHMSTRVNIAVLTDFLTKLMKLPMSFFETKTTGDILQRMEDQRTIENFLTSISLGAVFSLINLVILTLTLIYYNPGIFVISITGTIAYLVWIILFLKKRRDLNNKQFDNASSNQNSIVELVTGIQEIKLNNCEKQKRWKWEHIQARSFRYKVQYLALSQYQQGGAIFINQAQNIMVTFLSVKAVIDGQMTLGGMMAIQFIMGQISGPVEQVLGFARSYQDAKISLERLNEIHALEPEEPKEVLALREIPARRELHIRNLTFTYPGVGNEPALENINLVFPQGQTTAIVGMSGSGKTTLLKLILRFYEIEKGDIRVGPVSLRNIAFKTWRSACGTVLQDGFIFSDTILGNIAVGEEHPDFARVLRAIGVANLGDYLSQLPFGLHTKIGTAGKGLSQGQKQRLLIARAVYKNPDFIFFDEATNALDANNERIILDNLAAFFAGKTVVVVAHRLSTVRNADNIIVLDKGRVIEQGTHEELTALRGGYFNLVRNQLELGI